MSNSRVSEMCPDRMVPCWKSIASGVSRSLPAEFATLETSCGTPRHRLPLDTIKRSGSARVAPRLFLVRHHTSKTRMVPAPSLPPPQPLPHTRSALNSPDSENPGRSTYGGLHCRGSDVNINGSMTIINSFTTPKPTKLFPKI